MSLSRQIGELASANIVFLLSQFGILVALSRFSNIASVGEFGFVMAVIQPLFSMAMLGLRVNLATDAKEEFGFPTFVSICVVASSFMVLSALMTVAVLRPEYFALALPIAIHKGIELVSWLTYGAMQKAGKVAYVARSLFLRGPAALCLFAAALFLTRSANFAFWSQVLTWSAVLFIHDLPSIRRLGFDVSVDTQWSRGLALARHTLPLGIGQLLGALQVSLPRVIVETMLGLHALAFFTIASYIQRAALTLFNSIEQATSWRLSRLLSSSSYGAYRTLLRRLFLLSTLAGAALWLAVWLCGKPVLTFVFGEEYEPTAILLNWIAVALAFRVVGQMAQTALYAQRRFHTFGLFQGLILLITVFTVWIGISILGLEGAAIAVAVSSLVSTLSFILLLVLQANAANPIAQKVLR